MLAFTYVYFSEPGLFNELQPIQIKKFFPVSGAAQKFAFPPPSPGDQGPDGIG
jgi:hypothetical protein